MCPGPGPRHCGHQVFAHLPPGTGRDHLGLWAVGSGWCPVRRVKGKVLMSISGNLVPEGNKRTDSLELAKFIRTRAVKEHFYSLLSVGYKAYKVGSLIRKDILNDDLKLHF